MRFYEKPGGHYMEIVELARFGWCIQFYDEHGNWYCNAGPYESEEEAVRFANRFRPNWKEQR